MCFTQETAWRQGLWPVPLLSRWVWPRPSHLAITMGLSTLKAWKQQQLPPKVAVSFTGSNPGRARSIGPGPGGQAPQHPRTRPCVSGKQTHREEQRAENRANLTADEETKCLERGKENLLETRGSEIQNYLRAWFLVFTRVSGSHSFVPLLGDFFYLLLALLLHLLHLIDALAPLGTGGKDRHSQGCLYGRCVPAGTEIHSRHSLLPQALHITTICKVGQCVLSLSDKKTVADWNSLRIWHLVLEQVNFTG